MRRPFGLVSQKETKSAPRKSEGGRRSWLPCSFGQILTPAEKQLDPAPGSSLTIGDNCTPGLMRKRAWALESQQSGPPCTRKHCLYTRYSVDTRRRGAADYSIIPAFRHITRLNFLGYIHVLLDSTSYTLPSTVQQEPRVFLWFIVIYDRENLWRRLSTAQMEVMRAHVTK